MIMLDTSLLVDALAGEKASAPALIRALAQGEAIVLSTIVLYEWLRGPRSRAEIDSQEALFAGDSAIPFEAADARLAAKIYRSLNRARGREADIAIAATAIRHEAHLWTLNARDFADIPGLSLWRPR